MKNPTTLRDAGYRFCRRENGAWAWVHPAEVLSTDVDATNLDDGAFERLVAETEKAATLFYDMTPGQRDRALQWARRHDWGRLARWGSGLSQWTIVDVLEVAKLGNGTWTERSLSFDSYTELRNWAGY